MSYPNNVPPGTPGSPAPMGPPGAVPVYGAPYPGTPPAPPRSQRTGLVIVAIIAVLALITGGLAVYFFTTGSGTDDAASGEIFLEAAAAPGPDPFTTQIKVDPVPSTTATTKASTTSTTAATTSSGVTAVAATTGAKAGLYGGTMNNGRCDSAQLVAFLETNPDKAAAWVSALNRDPTLRWTGGTQVQVSQIRAYVAELTPLTLTGDTRVTNYGFTPGRATPRQAVLQAGTAVLVDRYGVPRTKCGCGNPLTKPAPVRQAPVYRNDPWPGWNPATVIVVQETTIVINNYTIINLDGSGYIDRPAGTTGSADATSTYTGDPGQQPSTTTTTTEAPTTTTEPPPTTPVPTLAPADFCAKFREAQARWSGVSADTPSQRQALAEEFENLTAAAPPDIKADMAILRDFIKPLLLSGDIDQVLAPPAEVNTAIVNIEAYLLNVCGIST